MKLLSRENFRNFTLGRAQGICCLPTCAAEAVDAHHIFNRNLFSEPHEFGGYFLENGAQLCSTHHYDAEATRISPEELWRWCEISEPAWPSQLDRARQYDCWGNEMLEDGRRVAGPLYEDGGFQKLLVKANLSWLFY